MTRVLIDTNIYSLAMRGSQEVVEVLRHVRQIGISAISLGARKRGRIYFQ